MDHTNREDELDSAITPLLQELAGITGGDRFHSEDGLRKAIDFGIKIPLSKAESNSRTFGQESSLEGQMLGKYHIRKKIGSGGMGVVYLARHVHLGTDVAVKLLSERRIDNPVAVTRFEREMRLQAQLDHPNVVVAIDGGLEDGRNYVVMRYVHGMDVSQIVHRFGCVDAGVACEIIRQGAIGLQYLHDNGLLHRDIKPANTIVGFDGTVRLIDFGLARVMAEDRTLTRADHVVGTLSYLAPEVLSGRDAVSERSDIYSLGATLCYLVSGKSPLKHLDSTELVIPTTLRSTLNRFLAADPDERFANAAEVISALESHADSEAFSRLVSDFQQRLLDVTPQNDSRFADPTHVNQNDSTGKDEGDFPDEVFKENTLRDNQHEDIQTVGLNNDAKDAAGNRSLIGRIKHGKRISWSYGAILAATLAIASVYCFTGSAVIVIEGDTKNVSVVIDAKHPETSQEHGQTIRLTVPTGARHIVVKSGNHTLLDIRCRLFRNSERRFVIGESKRDHLADSVTAVEQIEAATSELKSKQQADIQEKPVLRSSDRASADPREIAQSLLDMGGNLLLYPTKRVRRTSELPSEPFTILNIEVNHSTLNDEMCRRIGQLNGIKSLHLSGNPLTDQALRHISGLKHLQWLYLAKTQITDSGIEYLLPHGDTLKTLDLHGTSASDQGISRLVGFDLLRELILYDTNVGDRTLSRIDRFPELRRLDLSRTHISDDGLAKLASQPTLLYDLLLDGTAISDRGVDSLCRLDSLTVLSIKNTNLSETAVSRLRTSLPECEIVK